MKESFFYNRIFIGIVSFIIGLLIGMYILPGSLNVNPGPPIISSINPQTNEINAQLTAGANAVPPKGWITTEFVGPKNKAVRITSGTTTTYHYCNLPIQTTYLMSGSNTVMPLIDDTMCNPATPTIPTGTYQIPPGTLQTYSGNMLCFDPATGSIRPCRVDIYCFKDNSGNQTGITLVLME